MNGIYTGILSCLFTSKLSVSSQNRQGNWVSFCVCVCFVLWVLFLFLKLVLSLLSYYIFFILPPPMLTEEYPAMKAKCLKNKNRDVKVYGFFHGTTWIIDLPLTQCQEWSKLARMQKINVPSFQVFLPLRNVRKELSETSTPGQRMWNNLNGSPSSHFPDLWVFIWWSLQESLVRKTTYCVFEEINPHLKLRGLKMSTENTPFWMPGRGKSI